MIIVPPHLYERAKELIETQVIRRIGKHDLLSYQGKERWAIHKLDKPRPFKIESVFRIEGYYSYTYHLPRAMKKRGYTVANGILSRP